MADLTFTGECFLPARTGDIACEDRHRYAFARRFVAGKRVLDAACGKGYGSAPLGKERVLSYRQSFRCWLVLPWLRSKLWLEARQ